MFGELDYTLNTTEASLPGLHGMVTTATSALEAARGAHAIAVLTEWDEFVALGKACCLRTQLSNATLTLPTHRAN